MKPLSLDLTEQQAIFTYIETQINSDLPLATVIQKSLEKVRDMLKLDRLLIYQLETSNSGHQTEGLPPKSTNINRVTYESLSSAKIHSTLPLSLNKTENNTVKCWQKYNKNFALVIDDLGCSNLAPDLSNLMQKLQVKAKVVVPLLTHKLWGLLIAHQCSEIRQWTELEVQFLKQIALHLAPMVSKSQSYARLQEQKEQLEKQVENQAHQIEDALVAARIASQSKHEFLGNITHELKTPLTRVIGLSGTLLHWSLSEGRTPLPIEKQQQYLKTIQDSGKQLLKLINKILEFSEVQSGKHLLNARNISLFELCHEIMESLQVQAKNLGISLNLDYKLPLESNYFYGDRDRLSEILLNLLDNALKFTPVAGEVFLRIWQEKKRIILEVEDTGIGISPEQQSLLFESFKPLENFRQKIHQGAGIGLILTKHLVELHGGNIEVESQLGQGSIFRVALPISPPQNANLNAPNFSLVPEEKLDNKIVLVTQDEQLAVSLCQLLTTADYRVVWLIDAVTAINQIDFLDPKFILFDRDDLNIEIPDVADALAAIEAIDASKIVLLYSQITELEWQYLQEIGICDRFSKISDFALLLDKLTAKSDRAV